MPTMLLLWWIRGMFPLWRFYAGQWRSRFWWQTEQNVYALLKKTTNSFNEMTWQLNALPGLYILICTNCKYYISTWLIQKQKIQRRLENEPFLCACIYVCDILNIHDVNAYSANVKFCSIFFFQVSQIPYFKPKCKGFLKVARNLSLVA